MSTLDLTPQQEQEAGRAAFAIHSRILEAIGRGRTALWDMAEALYEFDETSGWLALEYDSLSLYLADPEVSMNRGTYNRLARTWRDLVVVQGLDPARLRELDQSKVAIVAKAIGTGQRSDGSLVTPDEALADAETLGARDLRVRYYGEPEPSNVEQDEGEPVTADAVALEAEMAGAPEQVAGEVVDFVYDMPDWVPLNLTVLKSEAQEALTDGASHPRISRRAIQVAEECRKLVAAWIATSQR